MKWSQINKSRHIMDHQERWIIATQNKISENTSNEESARWLVVTNCNYIFTPWISVKNEKDNT